MRTPGASGRVDLHVPFEDRDEVARHGARWDERAKVWYIVSGTDPAPFRRWLSVDQPRGFSIESHYACIAATRIPCWKCRREIEVICVFCEHGVIDHEVYSDFSVSSISAINALLADQLKAWPTFRWRFDRNLGRRVLMNHCASCGAPQSDYYLHCEPDGAFFMISRPSRGITFVPVDGCAQLDGDEGFAP